MSAHEETGPFYHGSAAALEVGEHFTAGKNSNYKPDIVMNHIYFTALVAGAGLAAELAVALSQGGGEPHVYEVEPVGEFEDDPNVTDKKFPGNPTRSYRSTQPLRIVREVTNWPRLAPEELAEWKKRLAALKADERAEIIN